MQRSTVEKVKQRFDLQEGGTARLFQAHVKDWLDVTAIMEVHDDHVMVTAQSPNDGFKIVAYVALDQIVSFDIEISNE